MVSPTLFKDRAQQVIDRFVDYYKKAYMKYFVQHIKQSYEVHERTHYLLDGPLDKTDIWQGWLKVSDATGKKWKDCFCYIRYNYCIQCYAAECPPVPEDGSKVKMPKMLYEIFPKGLELVKGDDVKPVTPQANAIWFKHERRNNYYLAPHEKTPSWDDCLLCIEVASKNALAPLNPNPVSRKAFNYAYRYTRWWYLPWGSISIEAPEKETFGMLVFEIVMHISVDDLPGGGFARKMLEKTIRSFIEKASAGAWAAASGAIDGVAAKIEPTIKEQLRPLAELEGKLKEQIDEKCMAKITEMADEKISPHLAKMVDVIRAPVVEGFKIFYGSIEKELQEGATKIREGGDLKKVTDDIEYSFRWSGWRKMRHCSDEIDKIWKAVDENRVLYPHMWPYWDFVRNATKRLSHLAKRASGTLRILVSEKCRDGTLKHAQVVDECLEPTLKWLRHDLGYECRNYFESRLFKIFWAPIDQTLLKILKEIVSPINDAIPDIMKNFLDINDILEDTLTKFLMTLCRGAVDISLKDALAEYEVEDLPEPLTIDAPPA